MTARATRVVPVVVAGLLAAGCGAASSGSGAAKPSTAGGLRAVQAAYATTAAQKSAKVRLVESVTSSGRPVTVTGSGAIDFADKAVDVTATVTGEQVEVRELHDTVYVKLPAATRSLLGGKTWASADTASLGALLGSGGSSLSGNLDPTDTLNYLEQVDAGTLHEVGPATIAGTPTTEYTATIDLRKVAAAEGGSAGTAITSLIKQTGQSSLPVTVWLDAKGVVRQLRVATRAAGSTPAVTSTVTLSDFGTPVSVTAPPAAQTTDLTSLLKTKLGAALGSTTSGT
jgi:hypothetical protein